MRVVAGEYRGLPLDAPPGGTTRPITDRVKESLFSILGHRFETPGELPEIDVLDLFAGSGGLGIEALSRGARSCLFVERDRRAVRSLRTNLARLKRDEDCRVSTENAWTMRIPATDTGYGLAFVDPPYRDVEDPTQSLDLLERLGPRLADNGLIVFRHEARIRFPGEKVHGIECVDDRTFGGMRVLLLSGRG